MIDGKQATAVASALSDPQRFRGSELRVLRAELYEWRWRTAKWRGGSPRHLFSNSANHLRRNRRFDSLRPQYAHSSSTTSIDRSIRSRLFRVLRIRPFFNMPPIRSAFAERSLDNPSRAFTL
ncbi:hypothetical protein EVAR_36207_1 [Eumeta japonica]|uniref:Uncharacterized protein n=1 Tax=Eumeta variegata TaxID=151549 RepID=A0A4C1VS07_EUMVA|nr:hypothetical protein EVAR_36207_1 [Eumeta japonica]